MDANTGHGTGYPGSCVAYLALYSTCFTFFPISILLPAIVGNSPDLCFLKIMNTSEAQVNIVESLKSRCAKHFFPTRCFIMGLIIIVILAFASFEKKGEADFLLLYFFWVIFLTRHNLLSGQRCLWATCLVSLQMFIGHLLERHWVGCLKQTIQALTLGVSAQIREPLLPITFTYFF